VHKVRSPSASVKIRNVWDFISVPVYSFTAWHLKTEVIHLYLTTTPVLMRGPFAKFVDWRQCAAVIQMEAVTVMPSCSDGGNVVVA
jgi:hypothetical protein